MELHTLRFWRFVCILPDDFSLRRLLANFSVCHELLDLFFVISEANTFRQVKVVINKSASFKRVFDKRRSCRIAFFSILYSWQWPLKGLKLSIKAAARMCNRPHVTLAAMLLNPIRHFDCVINHGC